MHWRESIYIYIYIYREREREREKEKENERKREREIEEERWRGREKPSIIKKQICVEIADLHLVFVIPHRHKQKVNI